MHFLSDFCLYLSAAIILQSRHATGNVGTKPLILTAPKRHSLGSVISNNVDEGSLIADVDKPVEYLKANGEKGSLLTKKIVASIRPSKYRLTTLTSPIHDGQSNYRELVKSRGCFEAKLVAAKDLSSAVEKMPEKSLVIFANEMSSDAFDDNLLKKFHNRGVTLGFLRRFKAVDDSLRLRLVQSGAVNFLENLDLPSSVDILTAVTSSKRYYGFSMVFAPFSNATSLYKEEISGVKLTAVVNLADLVLIEADDKMDNFCRDYKDKMTLFSHKLVSDNFPMFLGINLPRFVDGQDSKGNKLSEKWLEFNGQTGTDLVAPYRFNDSKHDVANVAESAMFAHCVLINTPSAEVGNFSVSKGALEQWENYRNKPIPENSIVLLNTGWSKKWSSRALYENNFPGLDVDAAKWLVEQRKAVAIGLDSLSLDNFALVKGNKFHSHSYLAQQNIPVLLNLKFSDDVMFSEFDNRCLLSFLRIKGGTSSPLALFGLAGFEAVKKVEGLVVPAVVKTVEHAVEKVKDEGLLFKRLQLGTIIRKAADCDCEINDVSVDAYTTIDATKKEKLVGKEVKLVVDPSRNKVTTLTQPGATPVNTSEGCIETIFIKATDIKVIKQKLDSVRNNMVLIFLAPDFSILDDAELVKVIANKKVTLGFFADNVVPSDIRNKLLMNNVPFFENLQRPKHSFDHVNEDRLYYGFKFVFSPIGEESSLPESLASMQPIRKINLADFVVYDSSLRDIANRCAKKAVLILSQKWGPTDQIPAFPGVTRPHMVDDGKKLEFSDHFGTHLDLPYHFNKNSKIDAVNVPSTLDYPSCIRVTIPTRLQNSFSISKSSILNWEANHTSIPEKSLVLFETGFAKRNWPNLEEYVKNYPGLSLEAAQFLVEERKVAGVGIDSLVIDDYSLTLQSKFPARSYLASKNIVVIPNIGGDLQKLPSNGNGICVMAYLRIDKGTGAQAALFGVVQEIAAGGEPPASQLAAKTSATVVVDLVAIMVVAVFLADYN